MSGSKPAFVVKIVAEGGDSADVIKKVKSELDHAAASAKHLGHNLQKVHEEGVWAKLRESTKESREKFDELGEHVEHVHEKITDLLPAMSALGAAGGIYALAETAEKTAEAFGELTHMAKGLGTTTADLQVWNSVAKLTDTSVEGMDKSLGKLNRTLGEVKGGTNKDAAALFAHLHLDPKHYKDAADALPDLANAFAHTTDATIRARMSMALFGKAGMDMIPLLLRGRDAVHELQEESSKLAYVFSGEDGENLERYNESMKKIGIATQGFTDELGAKLTPVLQPVIDGMTEWTLANRDWISSTITDDVAELAGWIKSVNWHAIGDDIRYWGAPVEWFVEKMGGAKFAVKALADVMLLKGVFFLGKESFMIAKFAPDVAALIARLSVGLVGAWNKVGEAAEKAAGKEAVALEEGEAAGAGLGGGKHLIVKGLAVGAATASVLAGAGLAAETVARGSTLAAGKARGETDDQAAADYIAGETGVNLPDKAGGTGVSSYGDIGDWFSRHVWGGGDQGTDVTPIGGVALKSPQSGPAQISTDANLTVYLPNAPPGTTVQATVNGVPAKPTVNTGQAFYDHYQ